MGRKFSDELKAEVRRAVNDLSSPKFWANSIRFATKLAATAVLTAYVQKGLVRRSLAQRGQKIN